MIDWWGLFCNSLWIVGLAVILAAFSMASYESRVAASGEVRLRQKLGENRFQLPLLAGMVMFCLGLLLSSHLWWEKAIWGLAAALAAAQAARLWWRAYRPLRER